MSRRMPGLLKMTLRQGTRTLLALAAAACAASPRPLPEPEAAPPSPVAEHDVLVQLVFGEEADLDLHVTDPLRETVYFGNDRSRLGGTLDADRRCGAPAPRVETVYFAPAPAGRYRVSVDYQQRCRTSVDEVPYRVVVEANGERLERSGVIPFGHTERVVVEFEARPRTD